MSEDMQDSVPAISDTIMWTIHLARKHRRIVPSLAISILCAGLLASMLFHSPVAGLIAVLLLLGAVKEFLFPVGYEIGPTGVRSRSVGSNLELAWKDVRRCIMEKSGVTLTPLPHAGRLDVFRGVTLRYSEDGAVGDRASVMAMCRRHIPEVMAACGDEPA